LKKDPARAGESKTTPEAGDHDRPNKLFHYGLVGIAQNYSSQSDNHLGKEQTNDDSL
jgi:hypothetical protein